MRYPWVLTIEEQAAYDDHSGHNWMDVTTASDERRLITVSTASLHFQQAFIGQKKVVRR